jgi:RNA polymerase sigma-70 factor (ECF subfamily)
VTDFERSDEELVALIVARNETAFRLLYDRYADMVYSVAMRVLADGAAAQDVVQDVFLRFWRSPARFDPARGRFISWLLSVARNRAVDEVRSRGRRRLHEMAPAEGADDPVDEAAADPARLAVLAAERAVIRAALQTLPDEQRQAIELAYFGGLTQQEIAARLGAPLGTIKTRVRLGMRKLRLAIGVETESTGVT